MTTTSPIRPAGAAMIAAALIAVVLTATASAGTYTVTGTCGAWTEQQGGPAQVTAYEACPTLFVRNVVGNFESQQGSTAQLVFTAPPGTSLAGATLGGGLAGGNKWRSELLATAPGQLTKTLLQCNEGSCYSPLGTYAFTAKQQLIARVTCVDKTCPNGGDAPRGRIEIQHSSVTVDDPAPPSVTVVGGTITPAAWSGGIGTVNLSGSDNTGIQSFDAVVDGDPKYGADTPQPCDYAKPVPCSDQPNVAVNVDLRGLPDGQHVLTGQSTDAAGNASSSPAETINVDNTPPLEPLQPKVDGGTGWRSQNSFSISWVDRPEQFAPIAGANYLLCPEDQPTTSAACQAGSADGPGLQRLDGIQLPGLGAWKMRLWLRDSAGNNASANGVTIHGLRLLAPGGKSVRPSHLTAGSPRGRHRLLRSPVVRLGHKVTIKGRLTSGSGRHKRGLAHQSLLVYRRISVQGARSVRAGTVTTDSHGRYAFHAGAGPGRKLSFVFPGGADRQGRVATVDVRVRAKLGLHPNRRSIVNGDAVVLQGRLRGGKIPPGGALLELQVYTRGRWRPFGTPRTDASGHYTFSYRFETVGSGTAKFRFRAVLRKQATYPFSGKSRSVAVNVHGA